MSARTLPRCLALLAVLLLVAPAAPAESNAVQPDRAGQAEPAAMRLQAVDAEQPRAPNIDMREALAYLRQNPGATYTNAEVLQRMVAAQAARMPPVNGPVTPHTTRIAVDAVSALSQTNAANASATTAATSTSDVSTPQAQPSDPRNQPAGSLVAPAQNEQLDCEQLVQNADLENPNSWIVYVPKVYPNVTEQHFSGQFSFLMLDRDGNYNAEPVASPQADTNPVSGADFDAFGTTITVPSDAVSIDLRFKFFLYSDNRRAGSDDVVLYEFFDATTGDYLDGNSAPISGIYSNNQWWEHTSLSYFNNETFLQRVRGKQLILRISLDNNNAVATPAVFIDDVTATACGPSVLGGRVTQQPVAEGEAIDLSNVALGLIHYDANGDFTVLSATTPSYDPSIGFYYGFVGLPPLEGDGDAYQVVYFNLELDADTPDDTRLGFWFGPLVHSFVSAQLRTMPPLDVTNLLLEGPDSYSEVVLREDAPVTLSWQPRAVSGDRYRVYMYDPELVNPNGSPVLFATGILDAGTSGLIVRPSSFPAEFNFGYGHAYHWFVAVYQPPYDSGEQEQYGWSYYERAVTFLQQPESVPNNPPPLDDTPPTGRTNADWTVMIYIAGDNDLGNLNANPNPDSNLQGQFASLKAMAARFPRVNIVTLTDFYGNTGTQFCFLDPLGTPDCQELGEQNTADPATLTTFVNTALDRYPAPHTMLVVSDHGHAITGVAEDTTTPNRPQLGPDKLRQAFEISGLRGRKLDILFYNTCLMGAFEVAFDAQPYANYMVASADMVWVLNFYDKLLPLLASNDPKAVATAIPAAYRERVKELVPDGYASMAAYDLSFVPAVNTALSALGQQLKNNPAAAKALLATIRSQVQVYDSSGNFLLDQIESSSGPVAQEEDALVDLVHLALLLRNDATFGAAAQGVLAALGPLGSGMILSREAVNGSNGFSGQKQFDNSYGLAVYFPNGNSFGEQLTLTDNYLNKGLYAEYGNTTFWDDFVKDYTQGYNVAQGPGRISQGPGRISQGGRPIAGQVLQGMRVYVPIVAK